MKGITDTAPNHERLAKMLRPCRVAWIGGGSMAPAITYMLTNGFRGEAITVHPSRAEIAGVTCVTSIEALPWVPDLAVLVIPKQSVVESITALAGIGCGGVICISSGFSESDEGADLQAALVEAAEDMPVIGPNCPGIANFLDGNAFMMDHFGIHAPETGIAVISNGGAYLSDLGCADRSQPIAYLIGLGNQAKVTIADMFDLVLDDPRVIAVNLYFEGLNDIEALSTAAAKAARKGIPVVAIKGGKSRAGSRAAQSHTASLSSDAAVASALFRRFCWIEVTTPSEAIETLKMLSFTSQPTGMRTGFITSSGSYAVLGGDIAEQLGLEMAEPGKEASVALKKVLPAYVHPTNPLDISDAHGWPKVDQVPIYQSFFTDKYDLAIQVMCYPPNDGWDMTTWDNTIDALAESKGKLPAAFINTLADALPDSARERMIARQIAPLQGLEDGLRAVAHVARYGIAKSQVSVGDMQLPQVPVTPDSCTHIDEYSVKQQLTEAGLRTPRHWLVRENEEQLPDNGKVVLKALVPGLLHKSEAGAVNLGIPFSQLAHAIAHMKQKLKTQQLEPEGFLVEEMIDGVIAELLIGIRRIPGVGLVLTIGIGGTLVELLGDSVTVILPCNRERIESALNSLKLAPTLSGYRGNQPAEMSNALDTIEALITFVEGSEDIIELEINPLLLTPTEAVIADAVLMQSKRKTL